ncbi:hypothetical protein TNCV_3210791 [Trichonephila clavipes]|nr:hypothetical protein TNCV_3210791 [Trichonephila clavipes]
MNLWLCDIDINQYYTPCEDDHFGRMEGYSMERSILPSFIVDSGRAKRNVPFTSSCRGTIYPPRKQPSRQTDYTINPRGCSVDKWLYSLTHSQSVVGSSPEATEDASLKTRSMYVKFVKAQSNPIGMVVRREGARSGAFSLFDQNSKLRDAFANDFRC